VLLVAIAAGAALLGTSKAGSVRAGANVPLVHLAVGGSDALCERGVTALPCRTLNAAYRIAHCGDTVEIGPGAYGGDQFLRAAGKSDCRRPVVFRPAPGATVSFNRVIAGSYGGGAKNAASWWTLEDVAVKQRIEVWAPAQHVTLDHIDGGSFELNGVRNVVVKHSDWGPCWSDGDPTAAHPCTEPAKVECCDGGVTTNHVTVSHNTFHDWNYSREHLTCLAPWGGNNITIEGNRIWNCDVFGIEVSSVGSGNCASDPKWSHLVIQNNWFGRINQEGPINNNAVVFTHGGVWKNTVIRYNSFAGSSGITTTSSPPCEVAGVTAVGNLGRGIGCVPGMKYFHNVWAGGPACGSTDVRISALPYVNASDQAAGNYHLNGSRAADNRVPCKTGLGALRRDRDGHRRPAVRGRRCDAGSEERR
jgi:hypothetical protein